jgi:hypothetical protein
MLYENQEGMIVDQGSITEMMRDVIRGEVMPGVSQI